MPLSNNILINNVNIDEDNFDQLSKFIKIFPNQNLQCTVFMTIYVMVQFKILDQL